MFKDMVIILKGLAQRMAMPVAILFIAYMVVQNLAHTNIPKAILPIMALGGIASVYWIVTRPKSIIHVILIFSHFIAHFGRYGVTAPIGLLVDILLALGLIILLIRKKDDDFQLLGSIEMIGIYVWILYTWLEIGNPRSPGPVAWFYAMRSISLYYLLTPIVTLGLFKNISDIQKVFALLIPAAAFTLYLALRQHFAGMNAQEMAWLMTGPIRTHFLRGKMRVFSALSDASVYGAYAAYITTVFGVYAAYAGTLKFRWFYVLFALANFYGMMLSGSRGPLGIIAFGGMVYLIMSKRAAMAISGGFAGFLFYAFLKYTTILQGNYNVARLRTALDPNDASLLVRKAKEAMLSVYMADKPIGGGIGSAGMWGQRFAPGSFLAETPTDGLYSRIWMETGIIGLYMYLLLFVLLVAMMGYRLWTIPESLTRQRLVALYSGFVGLVGASYVNELITQVPLSIYAYMTPALILLVDRWVKDGVDITDAPTKPKVPLD